MQYICLYNILIIFPFFSIFTPLFFLFYQFLFAAYAHASMLRFLRFRLTFPVLGSGTKTSQFSVSLTRCAMLLREFLSLPCTLHNFHNQSTVNSLIVSTRTFPFVAILSLYKDRMSWILVAVYQLSLIQKDTVAFFPGLFIISV